MRLFISINFDKPTIEKIVEQQQRIRTSANRGNYSHRENLHLTLAFLGERPVDDIPILCDIIDKSAVAAFGLTLDHVGYFSRNSRDIWWVGLRENPILESLQRTLTSRLRNAQFPVEQRRFTAHITLAREVTMEKELRTRLSGPIQPIETVAHRISLMQSLRIDGRLTYREVHGIDCW